MVLMFAWVLSELRSFFKLLRPIFGLEVKDWCHSKACSKFVKLCASEPLPEDIGCLFFYLCVLHVDSLPVKLSLLSFPTPFEMFLHRILGFLMLSPSINAAFACLRFDFRVLVDLLNCGYEVSSSTLPPS